MIIKVTLTDDEQKTINDAINILYRMQKYITADDGVKIYTTCNALTEILNDHLS